MLFLKFILLFASCDTLPCYLRRKNITREPLYLTSSEEAKRDSLSIENVVKKCPIWNNTELFKKLAKYNITSDGWQGRLKSVKLLYRRMQKKYYNNETKKYETFLQKMYKYQEMQEDKRKANRTIDEIEEDLFYHSLERHIGKHPNISFIPENYDVTDYAPEYSGDVIKDDYEINRRKRAIEQEDNKINVSKTNKESNFYKKIKKREIIEVGNNLVEKRSIEKERKTDKKIVKFIKEQSIFNKKVKLESNLPKVKNKRIRIQKKVQKHNKDLLSSLQYLIINAEPIMDKKHRPKRNLEYGQRGDDEPMDYNTERNVHGSYVSGLHYDVIFPELKRRKISQDFKKRKKPESSIMDDMYSMLMVSKEFKEHERKRHSLRALEYEEFTHPINKYTSTSTRKYAPPRTLSKKAATISVGASRYKMFHKNMFNFYKHRIQKRDLSGVFENVKDSFFRIGDFYDTIMSIYFKCIYNYLRDMYINSYFGPSDRKIVTPDADYMESLYHFNNLTSDADDETNATYTTYIYLNWYTKKYANNSTQYFCKYDNDTYILLNNKLKLYNATFQKVMDPIPGTMILPDANNLTLDFKKMSPPVLTLLNSEEKERLNLTEKQSNEKYFIVRNTTDPKAVYQDALNNVYTRINQEGNAGLYNSGTNNSGTNNSGPYENKFNNVSIDNIEVTTRENNAGNTQELVNCTSGSTDYPTDIIDKGENFIVSLFSYNHTSPRTTLLPNNDANEDILDIAASYFLSFFKFTLSTTKTLSTTPEEYTDITNDLFDKIERFGFTLYDKYSNGSKVQQFNSNTADFGAIDYNNTVPIDSDEEKETQEFSTLAFVTDSKIEAKNNSNKDLQTAITIPKVNNGANSSRFKVTILQKNMNLQKSENASNIKVVSFNISKRSKRSLFSKVVKGAKFVGHVLRPIEKGFVNVLDDVFGPYSSSDFKSDNHYKRNPEAAKKSVPVDSLDHYKRTDSISAIQKSKEDKSITKDQSDKSSSAREKTKFSSFDSGKSKETTKKLKSSMDDSSETTTKKKSKKKKKKHHKKKEFDSVFEERTTTQTDFDVHDQNRNPSEENESFRNGIHKTYDDDQLPSYIKNPNFESQTLSTIKQPGQLENNRFPDYNNMPNPYQSNNTFQDYNEPSNPYGQNLPMASNNNTFQDYHNPLDPHGQNQPFQNNTFQDYNEPQNQYNQPLRSPLSNNTFQDYNDPSNLYGQTQFSRNALGKRNILPDYGEPQNPYAQNQLSRAAPEINNTFSNLNDLQNPYGQNPYEQNQILGKSMGNNTFPDYQDPQNQYAQNQPYGVPQGNINNTFLDYNNLQNPAFANPVGNKTFPDYNDQNSYLKNPQTGNRINNNYLPDYNDQQNPYGRKSPFGMPNDTFPDYGAQQNPYLDKQPAQINQDMNNVNFNLPIQNQYPNGNSFGIVQNTSLDNSTNVGCVGLQNSDNNEFPNQQSVTANNRNIAVENFGNQQQQKIQKVNITNIFSSSPLEEITSSENIKKTDNASETNDIVHISSNCFEETTELYRGINLAYNSPTNQTIQNTSNLQIDYMMKSDPNFTFLPISTTECNNGEINNTDSTLDDFLLKESSFTLNKSNLMTTVRVKSSKDSPEITLLSTTVSIIPENLTVSFTKEVSGDTYGTNYVTTTMEDLLLVNFTKIQSDIINYFDNVSSKLTKRNSKEVNTTEGIKITANTAIENNVTASPTVNDLEKISTTERDTIIKKESNTTETLKLNISKVDVKIKTTKKATNEASSEIVNTSTKVSHTSKETLESVVKYIEDLNDSSEIRTILDKLQHKSTRHTQAKTSNFKSTNEFTTVKDNYENKLHIEKIPDYFTVQILGSPYILMKENLQKQTTQINVQTQLSNPIQQSSFNQLSNNLPVFNPYQNVPFSNIGPFPNFMPQPNSINNVPSIQNPFQNGFIPIQNTYILPSNAVQSQDYQPLNTFPEFSYNLSYFQNPFGGALQQFYPNFGQPLVPPYLMAQPPLSFQ